MGCCRSHLLVCMAGVLNTTGTGGSTPVARLEVGKMCTLRQLVVSEVRNTF